MRNQHWLGVVGRTLWTALILSSFVLEAAMGAEPLEEVAKTHARIDWHQIGAPLGRLLLIRKGASTCAVRFSEFHRGNNAKSPTVFNSGHESHHAEYDWYWQADGSGDFRRPNVQSGHGKLIQKPLQGIGRIAFQTGRVYVRCGPFKLLWHYPVSVSFDDKGGCENDITELAPTKWKETREVDIGDSSIRWYRCDEDRKSLLIPLDALR
jgi:hypothetical protein